MLFIASSVAPPFQKSMWKLSCSKCHHSPIGGVYYNTYCLKSTIQKLGFLCGSIATNDELVLLTIEGKWLKAIMHMTKLEFIDLLHPKQV